MSLVALSRELVGLKPHVVAVALIAARLFPVTFLCPLLGGATAPTTVRVALVLSLGLGLHSAAGVQLTESVDSTWVFLALLLKELSFGLVLGLVAGFPFDAARMGGRFMDLFRGTSAEASLPVTGTRESAAGDMLYQLTTVLAVTGIAFPWVLGGLWKSFGVVKLGAFVASESMVGHLVQLAMTALATGLAVGAPIAGVALAVDGAMGLLSRAFPQMSLQELATPVRILGGGAVLWLGVGVFCERLLGGMTGSADAMGWFFGDAR